MRNEFMFICSPVTGLFFRLAVILFGRLLRPIRPGGKQTTCQLPGQTDPRQSPPSHLTEVAALLADAEVALLVGAAEEPAEAHVVGAAVVRLPASDADPEEVLRLLAFVQHLQTEPLLSPARGGEGGVLCVREFSKSWNCQLVPGIVSCSSWSLYGWGKRIKNAGRGKTAHYRAADKEATVMEGRGTGMQSWIRDRRERMIDNLGTFVN